MTKTEKRTIDWYIEHWDEGNNILDSGKGWAGGDYEGTSRFGGSSTDRQFSDGTIVTLYEEYHSTDSYSKKTKAYYINNEQRNIVIGERAKKAMRLLESLESILEDIIEQAVESDA